MNAITETIFIGNYLDAQDVICHRAEGIRSMVCLDGKLRDVEARTMGLEALEVFELKDGPGNDLGIFERVVEVIGRLSRLHPKVLVQCHAGRSRSVVAVAAHLMRTQGLDWKGAVQFVAERREVEISPGMHELLLGKWLQPPKTGAQALGG